jgi:hypothetical protein
MQQLNALELIGRFRRGKLFPLILPRITVATLEHRTNYYLYNTFAAQGTLANVDAGVINDLVTYILRRKGETPVDLFKQAFEHNVTKLSMTVLDYLFLLATTSPPNHVEDIFYDYYNMLLKIKQERRDMVLEGLKDVHPTFASRGPNAVVASYALDTSYDRWIPTFGQEELFNLYKAVRASKDG